MTDATVELVEGRRTIRVSRDGTFAFQSVPPGHVHLLAQSARLGSAVVELEIKPGEMREVEIRLDPAVHRETVIVTASPDARAESEVYQPVNVVTNEELQVRREATLGETLKNEVGVSSSYFGPGSSRPVIRGLGGDRIRILEEGLGTADASNISPDHAVAAEAATAEQIEIVRGPATLLYGSNALGGVVNVIDDRIPTKLPAASVTGSVDLAFGTVASERLGAVNIGGAIGANVAWHLDVFDRDTDDYEIPGPPESDFAHDDDDEDEEAEEEFTGVLENSSLRSRGGALGASWIGDRGFFGVAVSGLDSNYGVPGHAHGHDEDHEEHARSLRPLEQEHEEGDEEAVRIDLDQRRIDVRGGYDPEAGPFRTVRVRLGSTDYEHVELEGDEVGTRFTNDGWELRLEGGHRPFGLLNGTVGAQFTSTDFAAVGEEAFVPPVETGSQAVFAFEEIDRGAWDLQFGARYERLDHQVSSLELPDRSFDGLSASVGAIWQFAPQWSLASSLARAVRLPTAVELYADGPHAATRSYEMGDPDLDDEVSLGLDLSLRTKGERWRSELTVFNNEFDGYIFESPTGEEEDELPVFQYMQADARFYGLEAEFHVDLLHLEPWHLELDFGGDYVRARLDGGENLPRIPPMRAFGGLTFRGDRARAGFEVRHVFEQEETAAFENPTDSYTMINAHAAYRFFVGSSAHELLVRGTNLTDELARSHVSPLKELAPLPGRDVTLAYRLLF